jgi:hypothetical protein
MAARRGMDREEGMPRRRAGTRIDTAWQYCYFFTRNDSRATAAPPPEHLPATAPASGVLLIAYPYFFSNVSASIFGRNVVTICTIISTIRTPRVFSIKT